jgi:hypothetical protein
MTQRHIYFKFISDDFILNNEQTELAKNKWLKYYSVRNKNTHYISYLMQKYFAGSQEIKYNTYKKYIYYYYYYGSESRFI